MEMEIEVALNLADLARRAAEYFIRLTDQAITMRGRFTIALSGGSTPRALYTLLASDPYREQIRWPAVHVFWGDERCVPPDHPDSNYRLAQETLLSQVPIPGENIHRMAGEKPPEQAAEEYEALLRAFFHLKPGEPPRFDMVLLGLGADGHTASLFPGTPVLREKGRLVAALFVEKLNAYRLTLTPPVLNYAADVIFLVEGAAKAGVLHDVLQGEYDPDRLPAQLVQPADSTLIWLIDRAAASRLNPRLLAGG